MGFVGFGDDRIKCRNEKEIVDTDTILSSSNPTNPIQDNGAHPKNDCTDFFTSID